MSAVEMGTSHEMGLRFVPSAREVREGAVMVGAPRLAPTACQRRELKKQTWSMIDSDCAVPEEAAENVVAEVSK